jgi:hypothetical protein
MQKEPPPFVWAVPDEKNILTCALEYPTFSGSHQPERLIQGTFLSYEMSPSCHPIILTNPPYSAVPQTRHLLAESTMECSYSHRNIRSSHPVLRYVLLVVLGGE